MSNLTINGTSEKAIPAIGTQTEAADNSAKNQTAAHGNEKTLPRHHNKKIAYAAFHLTNFLGFHVLFNSTVSLFIAYNLLPTKPAKATMDFMAKLAAPVQSMFSKITTPLFKFVRGNAYTPLTEEELTAKIAHSARSRVETAFMCIAGFLALAPVKMLEDHRAEFMNFVDHVVHPFRSKAERKAKEIKPEETPKETWGNLIRARIVGLAVVFGADALQQRFNNFLTYEKGNIDTAVWKWGAKTFDKMPERTRDKFVNFFTRKKIELSGIQSDMLPHLLRTIDGHEKLHEVGEQISKLQEQIKKTPDKASQAQFKDKIDTVMKNFHAENPELKSQVERAIFAEQSRLLITKELFLTLLISTVIYICAKTPVAHRALEKVRLKKPGDAPTDTPYDSFSAANIIAHTNGSHRKHAEHTGRKTSKIVRKEKITPQAAEGFTQKIYNEAELAGAQQLSV
jgi:hypothetical protein